MQLARRLILALVFLIAGILLGLVALETVLRSNPNLLLRGMAVPAPIDPPLTSTTYEVHDSDADVFIWRPDLIRPVPDSADQVRSRVIYETDSFGFRNHAPIPPTVDVVVLGRSISLAAHLAEPWPELLAKHTNWNVLNLSQPGSGLEVKRNYLRRFGLSRSPNWVIIEVVPSIDIQGQYSTPITLSQELVIPLIQNLYRRWMPPTLNDGQNAIYPLTVDLPGRHIDLTCCLHYLDFYSLDQETLKQSRDWANYKQKILQIVEDAHAIRACVALLYVPTKPDVYFPLALHSEQLNPALENYHPLGLDPDGWITIEPDGKMTIETIRRNSFVGHELVKEFAQQNNLIWIDPNEAMIQSTLNGHDSFMLYDSHWNQLGHQIVADITLTALKESTCP